MIMMSAFASAISAYAIAHPMIAAFAASIIMSTASAIFGGVALNKNNNMKLQSATYSDILQTQTSQNLPVPILYGTVKLAGNRIWQDRDDSSTIKRIVAFAEGEITEFTDIRLNDIPANEVGGCRYTCYYGTSEQSVDEIVGETDELERVKKVGSLKNIAYIAVSCPVSSKINLNYTLTSVVKGRKVRVYASPSSYSVEFSSNPAWCLLDFLTSYNGLGLCLDNNGNIDDTAVNRVFDLNSFIESAAFCDEKIPYTDREGNYHNAPRFAFNMVFDSQTSARNILDEIYRCCRGGLFQKNGKLQFKIDKAEAVCKVFTTEDIIKGSETFQTVASEDHYDILKLVYVSPEHEWQKVEAFAEVPEYRDGSPSEHSVEALSVTDFKQASRLAWYYINSKVLQPYFGSFQTGYKAWDIEVGDVIKFDSILMGLESYKVKVTSLTDDGNGVFTVNWRTYDERLYSDQTGSLEPRLLISTLSDIYAYPDDVKDFNVIQNQNLFSFAWSYNKSSAVTYEIRCGETWKTAAVIASGIPSDRYSSVIPSKGFFKFWICAFNGKNYSKNPALDILAVNDIPNMNEVVKFDVLDSSGGQCENTYFYGGHLKLAVNNVLWHNTNDKWTNAGYYQNGGFWGANVVSQGSFVSDEFDIGILANCLIACDYELYTVDDNDDVSFFVSYSADGEDFSDWQLLTGGIYNMRYCKFKVVLKSYSNFPVILEKFVVSVDVPDKFLTIETEVTSPAEGIVIDYDFTVPPSIVATVNDSLNAYAVVLEKTKNSALLKIYDNEALPVAGKLSVYLKGY